MTSNETIPSIVYPWAVGKFKGSVETRSLVIEKLLDYGYPELKTLKKPTARVLKAVEHLIKEIHAQVYKEKRLPWLLLISNSPNLLQALATYVPVTMALTHHLSVATTSNRAMVETFGLKKTDNPFDQDISGEVIERYQRSWLLFWNDINLTAPHIYSYHSYFADILNHRIRYKLPTVFTISYRPGKTVKVKGDGKEFDEKKMLADVEKYLGSSAAICAQEYCKQVWYHVKNRDPLQERIEI